MSAQRILTATVTVALVGVTVLGQGQPRDPKRTPGVQAGQDPNRAAFIAAHCKNPAPPATAGAGCGGGPAPALPPQAARDYTVTEIPGVIAAGQRWVVLWEDAANNADGIVGLDDGSLLIARRRPSAEVRTREAPERRR